LLRLPQQPLELELLLLLLHFVTNRSVRST
jgi:hypothetical protein